MNAKSRTRSLKNIVYHLSRINEWWLLSLGMMLFAFIPNRYVANGRILDMGLFQEIFITPHFYLALIVVFSAQIFLFASNDYYDRHVDALDPYKRKRNPVCSGDVTMGGVRALLIVSGILPFIASIFFGMNALIYTSVAMFIFFFYTAPPLRLKNKIGLDVISHALFVNTFPYFFSLVALKDFTPGTTFLLAVIMMRSAMAQLFQEIRDHDVDKQVESNTVVSLGQRRALWLVFSIYLSMLILSVGLLASYQIWGWGIELYYILIPILWFAYLPVFSKLMKSKNLGRSIERLWMGQGRTNRWQVVQYVSAFALYAIVMLMLWGIGYF